MESLSLVYILETENCENLFHELISFKSKYIESIYLLEKPEILFTPNDYDLLNHIRDGNVYYASSQLNIINAQQAWNITQGSPSVVIGIVDLGFGVPITNLDLVNKVLSNVVAINPTNNHYHGQSVSSVAAAETNNNIGLASIGNKSMLKFYDINSSYDAILQAAVAGCKVINCSWYDGACSFNPIYQSLIKNITDTLHCVIVAAAGNGLSSGHCPGPGGNGDGYVYPASYDGVISVTSSCFHFEPGVLTNGLKENWKDRVEYRVGVTTSNHTHNDKVDITSPGYDLSCTYYDGYAHRGSGTSFASPMVAGTAALIFAVNPLLLPVDVDAILKCSSRDIYEIYDNINYLNKLGSGRLDAGKAVQLAQTWVPGSAPTQQTAPTDIRWFEILSNGINTIEVESACAANTNPGYCNIGYRLQVVAANTNQTFKWLSFYSENSVGINSNIKYGNSIYLTRGIDYPFVNSSIGSIKVCVRVNECIPSIYYAEDRASACLGVGCTYNCPADITITGNYAAPLTESYTWVKSAGATNIAISSSVKLDASPSQGYIEFKPTTGAEYLLAEPTATGEFIVQAYNGCDAGVPSIAPPKNVNELVTDGLISFSNSTVYPNPTNGIIYLEGKNISGNIQILNTQGVLMFEKQIYHLKNGVDKVSIDLSNLPSGVYMLKGNQGNS
ncbi:MAG: S8 family serine peptidase, partial [Ferruginibacter sp.]